MALSLSRPGFSAAVLSFALLTAASVAPGNANAGNEKPHSSFYPLNEWRLSSSGERRWQPLLTLKNACHPYPAVDKWGNWSGGLAPNGSPSSECSDSSRGQVYVKGKWYGTPGTGKCAIMYSWYFPKDNGAFGAIGHRHDWESVILWIKAGGCSATGPTSALHAVSYSQHHGWATRYGARGATYSNGVSSDGHLKVLYSNTFGMGTHYMSATDDHGGRQALVDYGYLWQFYPLAAGTLSSHSWGEAVFPMTNERFNRNLEENYPAGF